MELRPISEAALEQWRKKYRQQLKLPVIPDYYEALSQLGKAFLVEEAGRALGYVILTSEQLLTPWVPLISELYLEAGPIKASRQLLRRIIERLSPRAIVGRTDDPAGFPLLMDGQFSNQIAALVYIVPKACSWAQASNMRIIQSSLEEAPILLPIYASVTSLEGGISDEIALTKSLALWQHYRLVVDDTVVAVCYNVPQTESYQTLVPLVAAAFRGQGYGRLLTAYAIANAQKNGKTIMAISAGENEAARNLWESLNASLVGHFLIFKIGD